MILRLILSDRSLGRAVLTASVLFSLLLFPSDIVAQGSGERPHLGLALSGGGALGMAHVGVLKVMEEAGLRPDYITGVSMGSVVGGMYAIGYKADSLEKLFKTTNWNLVLSNKIPEYKVIFPEKKHFHNSILTLPVTLRKVVLPAGLINGQQIEKALSFFAWPAADINDFSRLPIPFMCLATNVVTCKKVELKSGYLPDAIRASIAVPSIFTPIKIDSMFLLDGGIVRNFAASELQNMGADIIIGSYTGRRSHKEEELQSVTAIMEQLAFFTGLNDYSQQRKLVDLLIEPDLKGLSSTVFENADSIIQRGYKAALPYREYFRKLADSLNRFGPQKEIENILNKEYYAFDGIEVNGNDIYTDDQILGVLDIEPGEKIDKYLINEKLELLYGKVWFEKVKYRFIKRNDSLILAFDCIEKPRAVIYGSVHYDESLKTGAIIGMSVMNIITPRSVIDFNSYIARYYRLGLEYLQFIDRNQKYGLSLNFYTDNTLIPQMDLNGEVGDLFSRNTYSGLTLNRSLGLNNMVSISASLDLLNLIPDYVSINGLKKLSNNYFSLGYEYNLNTLDIKHFPNKGTALNLYAGTSKLQTGIVRTDITKTIYKEENGTPYKFERFYILSGNFRQLLSAGKKLTFSLNADLLYMTDSDTISVQNNFYLAGGISSVNRRSIPLVGLHANEIPVKKLVRTGAEIDLEIIENLHLNLMVNIAACQETDHTIGYTFVSGYGIGAGYMSVIGPLRVGIMQAKFNDEKNFRKIKGYLSFGYYF
jgi:NTE family protein